MELGENLKNIRKNLRGYTLQKVFDETGISVSFLSDIERGRTKPSLATLQKLANYYQVNLSDLLEDTQENKINSKDLYPLGLRDLLEEETLVEEVVEVMLAMERRAKRKPETNWEVFRQELLKELEKQSEISKIHEVHIDGVFANNKELGFYIWWKGDMGLGSIRISEQIQVDTPIKIDSENMSKEFVEKVLLSLLAGADFGE